MSMLTLRIDDKLDSYLTELAAATGKSKSEIAREALSGHMFRTRWEAATDAFARHARSMWSTKSLSSVSLVPPRSAGQRRCARELPEAHTAPLRSTVPRTPGR